VRTIILHYHLFKNAGTSIDAILKQNFGDKWVTREFPLLRRNNTSLVEEWIRETPDAIAFSSHTMMGPIPDVEDVNVISFMLLRDPIDRIKSAYLFERQQNADTWGAKLAKETDFDGYVRTRLDTKNDRQCRNFQTYRLASLSPNEEGIELERALHAAAKISVLGQVESIGDAVEALQAMLNASGITLNSRLAVHNRSKEKIESMNPLLTRLLFESNLDDLSLIRLTKNTYPRLTGAIASHP
jgi:hypothetical protein